MDSAGWRSIARCAVAAVMLAAPVAAAAQGFVPAGPAQPGLVPALPPPSQQTSSEEPAPPAVEAKAPAPVKAKLASCAVVTVAPGKVRADGSPWDTIASEPPDIRIVEATTGTATQCHDSWTCSVTLTPVTNELTLTLTDIDTIGGDDPMGNGQCAIGKICDFPLAKVTVRACE